MSSFLALPRVQHFYGPSCLAIDGHVSTIPKALHHDFGKTLKSIDLWCSSLSSERIARLLENAKSLESFRYQHSTKSFDLKCLDVSEFLAQIEGQVGDHLVELSISLEGTSQWITSSQISFSGFPRLRQLEFPLEIVISDINPATDQEIKPNNSQDVRDSLFLSHIIPTSVSVLSLLSCSADDLSKILDVMLRNFAIDKEVLLPALKDLYVMYPDRATTACKDKYTRLLAGIPKYDVALHPNPFSPRSDLTWLGGE